jgi:hypothetical protein
VVERWYEFAGQVDWENGGSVKGWGGTCSAAFTPCDFSSPNGTNKPNGTASGGTLNATLPK